jgi:hypothetical protein
MHQLFAKLVMLVNLLDFQLVAICDLGSKENNS